MKRMLAIGITFSLSCSAALAQNTGADNKLTEADKARVKAQVHALQRNRLDDAANANKNVQRDAARQGKAVDEELKEHKKGVDDLAKNSAWIYGADAMRHAAGVRKKQLESQAQAHKDTIDSEARKKAATQTAAAKKSAEGVQQSAEGLKSQIGTDGKFGLQTKGSNLHVRNYGK